MSFVTGLRDFFSALTLLLANPRARVWYLKRLGKALILGTILLILLILAFAILLWQAYEALIPFIPNEWVQTAVLAGGSVLLGLIGWLSAGPVAMLIMGIYLSQFGRWQELREALPPDLIRFPPFEDSSSLAQSILNASLLTSLVLICAVIAFIPFLSIIVLFVPAFALGKDWCWTADEQFGNQRRAKSPFLYCVGLGLVPALIASIPLLGVLSVPILQLAGLIRYKESDTLQSS